MMSGRKSYKGLNCNGEDRRRLRVYLYGRDEGTCQVCWLSVSFEEFTIDHKIPASRGGTNHRSNLRITHDYCNNRKADKLETVSRIVIIHKGAERPRV
jgi:5-methylcytosine-specific restriction endonuclease McrA